MLSLYERLDYSPEMHNVGQSIDACYDAMRLLTRVDIVRALEFMTAMHLQGQAQTIPDNRSDFGHDIALLEAAKTLWLLAKYAAKEAQKLDMGDHHDHLPDP